jgi:hypothetical protein
LWSDTVSPFVEICLNLVWLVPVIGSIAQTTNPELSDWTSFASNLVFDISGILTFMTSPTIVGPEIAEPTFVIAEVLTLGYGVLCVVAGVAFIKE